MKLKVAIAAFAASAGVWPHRKTWWGRMPNAKRIGWVIYAAGFVIWCFGYLSAGRAPLIDWAAATPWWISSFVPNLEAELGLALMFASMVPIYWPLSLHPWAGNLRSSVAALQRAAAARRWRHERRIRG